MKTFSRVVGCLFALGATFSIFAPAHATPDNLLIVPGQHLGRVFIGDSKAAVHRRLGAPQRTFKLAGGLTSELWRTARQNAAPDGTLYTLEVVYRRGVVAQIEATSPTFKTVDGLAADYTASDWNATYGKTRPIRYHYANKPNQRYYDWVSKGVALEQREMSATTEEGGEDLGHTVIVHRKGAEVVVDSGGHLIR